jgi:ELWxxDGT repeat protein
VNNTLFFSAETPASGRELWKSDGTITGTVQVADIKPGPMGSLLYGGSIVAVAAKGGILFVADDGAAGGELWQSDGTAPGTIMLQDIAAGAGSSVPTMLTAIGGQIFFTANDNISGQELWVTSIADLDFSVPIASSTHLTITVGRSISGTLAASDRNGDRLTFSIFQNGSKGTATITNPNTGAFTYTPAPYALGADQFTFKVSDSRHDSNVATIAVTIDGSVIRLPIIRR